MCTATQIEAHACKSVLKKTLMHKNKNTNTRSVTHVFVYVLLVVMMVLRSLQGNFFYFSLLD